MNVTYISACFDTSGYAEAARNYIGALDRVGITVDVVPISFEQNRPELGKIGELIRPMIGSKEPGKICILHMTPTNFPKVLDKKKYNIGYSAWETDRIPDGWADCINQLDEIWVPSNQNVEAFKTSGVTVPIFRMPHCFDKQYWQEEISNSQVSVSGTEFKFLSIFQWTERKNPIGLLKAYLTEFRSDEQVSLTIKTYLTDPKLSSEREKIKEYIGSIKQGLHLPKTPKIYLVLDLLSRAEIQKLHASSDSFVLLHRNEGFGVPVAEAMMMGKPVITTGYGGTADFVFEPSIIDPDIEQTGYLVDHSMTPVFGMPWNIYSGNQTWAEPDIMHARKQMRSVFTDRVKSVTVGKAGQKWVEDNLSWETVGNLMKARLEQISKRI